MQISRSGSCIGHGLRAGRRRVSCGSVLDWCRGDGQRGCKHLRRRWLVSTRRTASRLFCGARGWQQDLLRNHGGSLRLLRRRDSRATPGRSRPAGTAPRGNHPGALSSLIAQEAASASLVSALLAARSRGPLLRAPGRGMRARSYPPRSGAQACWPALPMPGPGPARADSTRPLREAPWPVANPPTHRRHGSLTLDSPAMLRCAISVTKPPRRGQAKAGLQAPSFTNQF